METSLTTDGMRLNTRHRKWRLVVVVLAVSVAPILPHEPFLNQRTKGPISARPAQPFDAGDFYSSPAGKHRLLRLAQPAAEHTASLAKVKSHRATAAFVEPDSGLLRITTDEILLRLKPQVDPRIYFGASWPRVRRLAGTREQFILTLPQAEAEALLAEANRHASDSRVVWAQPNFLSQVIKQTADPLFVRQWSLENRGLNGAVANADVHALNAWDKVGVIPGIIIALLDDGVQLDHPDLTANIFYNEEEFLNHLDEDGNGYVDDLHGWDFYRDDNDPSPEFPEDKHGTATAGIAAATANNAKGIAGLAYNCQILPLKVMSGEGLASDSALAEAIYYAAGRTRNGLGLWRGADIISISLSFPPSTVVDDALSWAATKGRGGTGCPIFAAAGDDASRWLPTRIRVDVGALNGPGTYRFGFEYSKDVGSSDGEDLVKIDNVALLGSDGLTQLDSPLGPNGRQDFEGVFPPSGWKLALSAGAAPWSATASDALTGTKGSISARSGIIGDKQWTELRTPLLPLSGGEILSFSCYLSSEADFDGLRIWVYDANDDYVTVLEGPLDAPLLSGNPSVSHSISYPARHPSVMAVGASTDADVRADYSQSGLALDFLAPSSGGWHDIITTDRTGTNGYVTGDYVYNFGGTSAACPLAAGIGALVLSINPSLTAVQMQTLLRRSCDKIGGLPYDESGWNPFYGSGRLNAEQAVANAKASAGPLAIQILAPTNNATFAAPANLLIAASTPNHPGTILRVEFFNGKTQIGAATAPPYGLLWTNLSSGRYTLTARVTDYLGRTSLSPAVTVQIVPPIALLCATNKDIEYGASWDFDPPAVLSSCGQGALVVLTTFTNTIGLCGNTFTATRTWQAMDNCGTRATCSQVVKVVDTTPPLVNCSDKGVVCGTAWSFDPPVAFDLASGTNLAFAIASTTTNGDCSEGFSATRTWNITDLCGNISTCSQTVTNVRVAIQGTIYYPATYPSIAPSDKRLAQVTLILDGDELQSTGTGADGSYFFSVNAGENVNVAPVLANANPTVRGVTTLDLSLIRHHILHLTTLDSPYKILAADVNASKSISTLDLAWIQKVVLSLTNTFPAGVWRWVPADYVFPDPQNPWDAPRARPYTNLLENAAGQDFVAIPLGDVNYSWTPSAASLPLAEYPMSAKTSGPKVSASSPLLAAAASGSLPEVIFQISRHTNQPKDLVTAQVSVSNFRQVTSAQFTLVWDPEVLRFLTTGDYGIRGLSAANFNTRMTDKGHLAFSWNDPQALGITMADGTPEFKVSFEVIGNAGDISPLELVDSITEREVGVNFARAPFRAQNGDVTVVSPALAQSPRPTLTRAASVTNAFSLSLPTSTGLHYTLEYANILPTTTWKALFSVLGDGANKTLTDPSPPSQQRFYRVRIE